MRAGAASLSLFCFCAVSFATFGPLRNADGRIQHLFVQPSLRALAIAAVAAVTLLLAHAAVVFRSKRHRPDALSDARSGRWLSPFIPLGAVLLGIAPAIPGIGERATPLSYVLYDLRWWWLGAAIVWAAVRAHEILGSPLRVGLERTLSTVSPRRRLRLLDVGLFAVVALWATATTPNLRFTGELHGDEPKYLRYCELWFQGQGIELSSKKRLTDDGVTHIPLLHRLPLIAARAAVEETQALVADLAQFAAHPTTFRWNRARGESGFLAGKRGGVYQKYQPGTSLFLFPGYVIDRLRPGARPGYQEEFPASLFMTGVMMLLVYGACAVALFRLLRHVLTDVLGWLWAAAAMIALPAGAFAFQLYPELPALLLFITATTFALFRARNAGRAAAALAGMSAGGLAMIHPRFLLLSLLLAAVGFARSRGQARRAFVIGCALLYFSVGAFAYRTTGSWWPTALWDATATEEQQVFAAAAVPVNLLAYALHRTWGILPHAPLLILVPPGLALLARRSPGHAAFLVAAALSLGIAAAGHTLTAAGGTPGRLIMSVVPIFAWPAALLVRRYWHAPVFRAAVIVLAVVSLESATTYNWHHAGKSIGILHSDGLSGWRPNLMFPLVGDEGWLDRTTNVVLLLTMLAAMLAACVFVFSRANGTAARSAPATRRGWLQPALATVLIVAAATVATSANGYWYRDEYLPNDARAHRRAAHALTDTSRCQLCFATTARALDWRWLEPNPAGDITIDAGVDARTLTVHVTVAGDMATPGFGRMRVEFGDGAATPWLGIVGHRTITHRYDAPGEYRAGIWVQFRDGTQRGDRKTLTVR